MSEIWMAIAPSARETRVIAMAGATETIFKARLSSRPSHPRALSTLLEAIALWQGQKVRAALCADERAATCGSSRFHEALGDFGGPLYSIDWVPNPEHARRRHRDIEGVGGFADLRRLLMTEVAR